MKIVGNFPIPRNMLIFVSICFAQLIGKCPLCISINVCKNFYCRRLLIETRLDRFQEYLSKSKLLKLDIMYIGETLCDVSVAVSEITERYKIRINYLYCVD